MDFSVLADHRIKLNESEKRDKYCDLARDLKKKQKKKQNKTIKHEWDADNNCNWHARHGHENIDTGTGGLENKFIVET